MPFTISHAAAVLPFSRILRRWRVLSAMVIGSMVPDFGLFMPWRPARFETHSALGLLTFCLPVGLAAFWVFQRVIKTPVLELLPDAAYQRSRAWAAPAQLGSARAWWLAAGAILLGALTHLVWDAFTHEGARGVRMFPALDDPAVDIAGHHLVGTRLLQDASSLVGLVLVLAMLAYGLRGAAPAALPERRLCAAERRRWLALYVSVALAATAAFYLRRWAQAGTAHSLAVQLGGAAIAVLRGTAGSLLAISLLLGIRLRARP